MTAIVTLSKKSSPVQNSTNLTQDLFRSYSWLDAHVFFMTCICSSLDRFIITFNIFNIYYAFSFIATFTSSHGFCIIFEKIDTRCHLKWNFWKVLLPDWHGCKNKQRSKNFPGKIVHVLKAFQTVTPVSHHDRQLEFHVCKPILKSLRLSTNFYGKFLFIRKLLKWKKNWTITDRNLSKTKNLRWEDVCNFVFFLCVCSDFP